MAQERKVRPGTGDKDDEQGFENVTVPPVGDISVKLAEAMKREQMKSGHGCGVAGCWCDACLYANCQGHVDPFITAAQYRAGMRRKV